MKKFLPLLLAIILIGGCQKLQLDVNQSNTNALTDEQATNANENTNTAPETITYTNNAYNFTLTLPATWAGYNTKNRTLDWGTAGTSDSIDFGFPAQDSIFNISIHSETQWQTMQAKTELPPTYLGESEHYIFAYAIAQYNANDDMAARMKEVESILKTFTPNYSCKTSTQSCQSYSQGVGGGDNCCLDLKCDQSGPDGTSGKCVVPAEETQNSCKTLNQSCQSRSQGVGGGDNCCANLTCDQSGPDGTSGKCVAPTPSCQTLNQTCQSRSQGVGGGDNCCSNLKCDQSGPDGTSGKCVKE